MTIKAMSNPTVGAGVFCATGASAGTDKFSVLNRCCCSATTVGNNQRLCAQAWGRADKGVPSDGTYSGSCSGSDAALKFSLKKVTNAGTGAARLPRSTTAPTRITSCALR